MHHGFLSVPRVNLGDMKRPEPCDEQEELAWAAGFFDGEGCFTYTRAGGFASVAMVQTRQEPLERFRKAVGTGSVTGPYDCRSPTRPTKQEQYQFHAYGFNPMWRIAGLLWPHLGSIKCRQALAVLARSAKELPFAPTPA